MNNLTTVVPDAGFLKKHSLPKMMERHNVIVPMAVIRKLKKEFPAPIRFIDELSRKGGIGKGVSYNGFPGKLKVVDCLASYDDLRDSIIKVCLSEDGLLASYDDILRITANCRGVTEYEGILSGIGNDFGYEEEVEIPEIERGQFQEFLMTGRLRVNQFCLVFEKDGSKTLSRVVSKQKVFEGLKEDILSAIRSKATLVPVPMEHSQSFGIIPDGPDQRAALNLLLDPTVPLVNIINRGSGCGGTILSLAAALGMESLYPKVMLINCLCQDSEIGFLTGSKEVKLAPAMKAFVDILLAIANNTLNCYRYRDNPEKFVKNQFSKRFFPEALGFIRGMTIENTLIIVKGAQELTNSQIKTLVTRVGRGSKMVLLSNLEKNKQNGSNEGASNSLDLFIGHCLFGQIQLSLRNRRSRLAEVAECL